MSTIADFNRIEDCNKIDSKCVDAFVEFTYDQDTAPTTLCVDSSWGSNCIDLTPVVKAAETVTTLQLSPEETPNCLVYTREDGDTDCITGNDLSSIISMAKLKDVSQDVAISDGEIYSFNGASGKFVPFDLATALTTINANILDLQNRVTALERTVADHETRIQALEGGAQ